LRENARKRLSTFLWAAAIVLAISVFFASFAFYYGKVAAASEITPPLGADRERTFIFFFARFFPLALLAPAIFALGERWSLFSRRWKSHLAYHLGAGFVFAAVHVLLSYGLMESAFALGWARFRLMTLEHEAFVFFRYNYLFYWIVLCVSFLPEYYQRYRAREFRVTQLEAKLAQANLRLLKMQLNPHFLFNTLNSISALIYEDPGAADRVIARLSDLLRQTLDYKGDQEISVKKEMEFLRPYLDIMKIRFAEKLRLSIEVAPETEEARVPALLLQPLVENAVRHGVLHREDGGRVALRIRRSGTSLVLEVEDDGPGLGPAGGAGVNRGIGLAGTAERLIVLYGERHAFDLITPSQGGTLVRMEIPFHTEPLPGVAPGEETTE
jgi:two-component system LytT family sensor kinase